MPRLKRARTPQQKACQFVLAAIGVPLVGAVAEHDDAFDYIDDDDTPFDDETFDTANQVAEQLETRARECFERTMASPRMRIYNRTRFVWEGPQERDSARILAEWIERKTDAYHFGYQVPNGGGSLVVDLVFKTTLRTEEQGPRILAALDSMPLRYSLVFIGLEPVFIGQPEFGIHGIRARLIIDRETGEPWPSDAAAVSHRAAFTIFENAVSWSRTRCEWDWVRSDGLAWYVKKLVRHVDPWRRGAP